MLITITGKANATVTGDRTSVLKQLDGVESADSVLQHLPQSLTSLGIEGGKIALEHDPAADCLSVVTRFRCPGQLNDEQLKLLQDSTTGQWTDGLGAGCFDEVFETLRVTVELLPSGEQDEITTSQTDDGVVIKKKCAVYHQPQPETWKR